jgi:glutamate/tyrosine decarboxylase-like PLP-dependent enzyme
LGVTKGFLIVNRLVDAQIAEETLDPQDWDAMHTLAHKMVDDMLHYLHDVRERPIWQPIPAEVKERLQTPVPHEGTSAEAAYQDFSELVLPYPMGNIHPRFWAWVMGNSTPLGMMGDMLAAGLNSNLGGGEHGATYVEAQTLDWCKEMLGYPADASGLLVSGGSMANLVGLAIARNVKAGYDVRQHGVGAGAGRLMFYASTETHSCVQRALEVLGLGSESLHKIAVNDDCTINIAALEAAIAEDRAKGYVPICIVGNAGTVNTGAYDDLERLADICQRENFWFHVDGAIGALTRLAPELRPLTDGMERADSLAVDLHKWLHAPIEAGCTLVRHADQHYHTFTLTPEYLKHGERGLASGERWFSDFGIQLSRGFRALKIWLSIKEQGIDKLGRLIAQNVHQVRYLAERIDAQPDLERMSPAISNIVCFRYRPSISALDDVRLGSINKEIVMRLQESGHTVVSTTTLNGAEVIRVCINNHRTVTDDLDVFVAEVVRVGGEIVAEWGG